MAVKHETSLSAASVLASTVTQFVLISLSIISVYTLIELKSQDLMEIS